jgi:dTDP-4-amino-4,6-dideoxygalactose transaminase
MKIPLVDLAVQYRTIQAEVDAAIRRVLERSAFIGGEEVEAFAAEFAAYCAAGREPTGPLHCAPCGNGTDALYLALRALGIGPGDEVITVAHTFIATAEAIGLTGARPVFVDVLPDTLLMDPAAVEAAVTTRTRAIVPVHLYGQPCDMSALLAIARRHQLKVVEDAAQAHGAAWRGRRVGGLGDLACFSFYPGKNLGACGDGGAVVGADGDLVRRIRMLANHGRLEKYTHEVEGVNSRLDGLQAAVLRVKLRRLDAWNAARRAHAAAYSRALAGADLVLPAVAPEAESVWHLYVVRSTKRTMLQTNLRECGVATGVHYPLPLHLQPAYASLGLRAGSLPVTEQAAGEILSLPLYPELTPAQIDHVATVLQQ